MSNPGVQGPVLEGQLNAVERQLLEDAVRTAPRPPRVVLEVGTWLGGGSTLHLLRALEARGSGHLWGIEADPEIFAQMKANLQQAAPQLMHRFTPLLGFSQQVIPRWLAEQAPGFEIDLVFLDGGNRPMEQMDEFFLLDPHLPVGARLLAHDAKLRKGKYLVPYLSALDNWRCQLHDVSVEGLFWAEKTAPQPSPASLREARRRWWRRRLEPAEVAAVVVPHAVRKWVFQRLPARYARKYAEGRQV
ncbi:class I SAM-dependent methyltransferase [Fontisphaera persica]|uniref:O-methyltransferase n=1 Tax=Fontisphaera persica TaxID=2974023 RepID=UPI0024C0D477|nr:class I SAM-dependent methyltransferase [Fontisphaera persica]WCJ60863.1 class I SAM-dependent methyltransferase [Fontisphaera persica]